MKRIVQWSIDHHWIVIGLSVLLLAAGAWTARQMPIDVFPDLTAPTVTILTECPGLAPEEVEESVAQVEVRQIFRASRIGIIAGCYVTEGTVTRGANVRVVRDGTVVYDSTIQSLRRFNDDVREVQAGFECGIVVANFQDIKEGDVLEVYETRQVERTLS